MIPVRSRLGIWDRCAITPIADMPTARRSAAGLAGAVVASAMLGVEPASADTNDPAVYEVSSEAIPAADVTYFDGSNYQHLKQVSLPWTIEVSVGDLTSNAATTNHAEVLASWPVEQSSSGTVTVRIRYQGKLLSENTRSDGQVGCSLSTFSFHWR